MKRSLTIIAIVIVLAGVGAAVYFYFFGGFAGNSVSPTASTTLPTSGQTLPPPNTGVATTTAGSGASGPVGVTARLVKISSGPVASGEVVIDRKAVTTASPAEVVVNYIERQSGNVFSYLTSARVLTRTSNKTIPGIQSASWLPDGSLAFVRYLSGTDFETINTFALPANGTGGFFLPQNLADISVASTSILTLASGVNGSTASLSHTDGTHATTVFSTPLSSLRASLAGKSQYLVTTKASATLPGDAFLVDATGHLTRIAGPLNGLVALASPSGKWVLVSYTLDSLMHFELVNTTTGEVVPLPVATIADKCVWTANDASIYCGIPVDPPAGFSYPDDWYQGAVQFGDRIWKIDVADRFAQLVLDFPTETNSSLDAESLAIDPQSTVLVFVNKNDGSLWSYQL